MKNFSFGVLMLSFAIFGSTPRISLLDFAAGNDTPCEIAVALARCNSTGFYDCNSEVRKCNTGGVLNAITCEDDAGEASQACYTSADCKDQHHADRDNNCELVEIAEPPPIDPIDP